MDQTSCRRRADIGVAGGEAGPAPGVDLSEVRSAINETRKMLVVYSDEKGERTQRTIWPIAMAYYTDVTLIGAWCELRRDYRHFRVDRIATSTVLFALATPIRSQKLRIDSGV